MSRIKPCNICGKEADPHNGGCVIQIAFCRYNNVSLTNVSYCKNCYDNLIDDDLRKLNDNAHLQLWIDAEDSE